MNELQEALDKTKAELAGGRKVAKKLKKTKSEKAPNDKDQNVVTLAELCEKAKVETVNARAKLRRAGLKPDGRWEWKKGSKELAKAKEIIEGSDDE